MYFLIQFCLIKKFTKTHPNVAKFVLKMFVAFSMEFNIFIFAQSQNVTGSKLHAVSQSQKDMRCFGCAQGSKVQSVTEVPQY